MEEPRISPVMEDYLKTIFHLLRRTGGATTGRLAGALGVSAPTATQALKRLAALGLIEHRPYRGASLTAAGERIALEVIRHHRLIECYLHEALGVPPDRVHREAERWEHVLSDEVEERMARALDHPTRDPHGSPIPTADLILPDEDAPTASRVGKGGADGRGPSRGSGPSSGLRHPAS
jgi:DtxR family Mn-dependent transcriptional regulator